ncbi:MAG: DUF3179 domain-containing protein [Pseudomonadota bacterium]
MSGNRQRGGGAGWLWWRIARASVIGTVLGVALQPWTVNVAEAVRETVSASRTEWPKTDFSKRSVEMSEIMSGGPPKDGIPPIDRPRFAAPAAVSSWLMPSEPVVALEIGGDARAYPLQILTYHEIVNDTVGGTPVAVTFCPLCNAAIAFDRRVKGRTLDFGTTGRLRKSDLVMYDRQTESWWQQFSGEAIVGEFTGTVLTQLPATIVAFEEFRRAYPDGKVLTRETGFSRPYGRNPYRGYDRVGETPFLFNDPVDPRLPAMERVLNVSEGKRHRVYPFRMLVVEPVINDIVGGEPIVVLSKGGMNSALDDEHIAASRQIPAAAAYSRRLGDRILTFRGESGDFMDSETGSRWNLLGHAVSGPLKGKRLRKVDGGVHFAFAWLAFNPDSEIYGQHAPKGER